MQGDESIAPEDADASALGDEEGEDYETEGATPSSTPAPKERKKREKKAPEARVRLL